MVFYINSKNFALKTIAVFLIFLSYQNNISAQKKPNVIFILSDDVGYDLLSVNGNKSYSTPNIDSMAHHGINFTHCEGMPLCSPGSSQRTLQSAGRIAARFRTMPLAVGLGNPGEAEHDGDLAHREHHRLWMWSRKAEKF